MFLRLGKRGWGLLVGLCWGALPSQAVRFSNQFIEFELPPQWQCALERTEWVCQNTDESRRKEAILVFVAKLVGPQDTLDQYHAYLSQPRAYTALDGKAVRSEQKYTRNTDLGGHPWIDSLHLESEIPGFFTRYLATVKQDLGVLVSYSILREKYPQYSEAFETLVQTLRVFRKPGGVNASTPGSLFQAVGGAVAGGEDSALAPPVTPPSEPLREPASDDETTWWLLGGGVLIAALIWIWKKKRSSG